MNIHLFLEMAADAAPDRIAIGTRATGITYGELLAMSRRAAQKMIDAPIRTVTYCGLNRPEVPVALFAASLAGKPFTPLNYRLPDADLKRLLERSAPSLTLCDADIVKRCEGVADIHLQSVDAFFAECSHRDTGAQESGAQELAESTEDIAVVLFTSGTTAEPKAAILRHSNLVNYVLSTLEFLSADESEAALISVPPYHIAGMSALLTSVYCGRRIVSLPAFDPGVWVDTVIAEGITHAMVVPTMLKRIVEVIAERNVTLPSLRALSYGGGRMPAAVIERAMDLLPEVGFVNAYGLTETSSTIAILDPASHREAKASGTPEGRRRLSSVGKPLPHLELEIRDENEAAVPAGVVGEIWVRGSQVSGEYEGRKVIRDDGWFPTNDAGWIDDEGFLFVEGRLDDVIVRGGENISPAEIEDVLITNSQIDDVAVVGLPDEEWGEKIVAAIVVNAPVCIDQLKNQVRERLRSTRVPSVFVLRETLPYNDTGKLLRRQLRQELAANISASDAAVG